MREDMASRERLMEEMSQSVCCLRMWCFNCTGPVAGGYGKQRAFDGGDEPASHHCTVTVGSVVLKGVCVCACICVSTVKAAE